MACYWHRDSNWLFKSLIEFNDPIQGQPSNCTFVAALSSVAWVNPSLVIDISWVVTDTDGNVLNKVYKVTYYNAPNGSAQDVYVTDYLKWGINTSGNYDFCWVKSKTEREIWPGIYEKAYAAFRLGTYGTWDPLTSTGNPIDQPINWNDSGGVVSGSTQWPQFGLTPIKNLTGLMNEILNGPAINSSMTGMQIFNDLFSRALPLLYCAKSGGYNRYRLRRPIVTWTGPNVADPSIATNHTYSVLGLIKHETKTTSDIDNYLVLRNPTGLPGRPTNRPTVDFCGILIDGTNGVFAISAKDFRDNFQTYGWVQ